LLGPASKPAAAQPFAAAEAVVSQLNLGLLLALGAAWRSGNSLQPNELWVFALRVVGGNREAASDRGCGDRC